MKTRDRQLGMDADISRRDFLNGVSIAIGASMLPTSSVALAYYSPAEKFAECVASIG